MFSEDNTQLIASVKGVPPTPGFLAVWDVAADGSLSEDFLSVTPGEGGLLPFSMTIVPGKNAILATDAGVGFDIFDFGAIAASANSSANATGAADRSSVVAIDGQSATCWSSFSPKTGNFYLTDIGTSLVTEVNVDDNLAGSLVKVSLGLIIDVSHLSIFYSNTTRAQDLLRLTTTSPPLVITSRSSRSPVASLLMLSSSFMYILTPNVTAVNVMSLVAPGQAQIVQQLDIAGPAGAAGLTVSEYHASFSCFPSLIDIQVPRTCRA